ncbi:cinnamoyl-CoA reductase 1-like [Euphorbia lathyris]|uniref:cinnamoyl-CoA reductase 1-like n=1 Tax=Euphorbia lathyris TaxID=212925 RepID=UPI00331351A3
MSSKEKVCVTGAGGFLASWLVNLLLSKGYIVNGTLRDPYDDKNAHLKKLENSAENLKLFKAHLLDFAGISGAIQGCTGVFHVASPLPPQAQLVSKDDRNTGEAESVNNDTVPYVDVRDTAEALFLVYEKPESKGRYICSSGSIFGEGTRSWKLSSRKLQDLGWNYRPLEETLVDSVKSYQDSGAIIRVDAS